MKLQKYQFQFFVFKNAFVRFGQPSVGTAAVVPFIELPAPLWSQTPLLLHVKHVKLGYLCTWQLSSRAVESKSESSALFYKWSCRFLSMSLISPLTKQCRWLNLHDVVVSNINPSTSCCCAAQQTWLYGGHVCYMSVTAASCSGKRSNNNVLFLARVCLITKLWTDENKNLLLRRSQHRGKKSHDSPVKLTKFVLN